MIRTLIAAAVIAIAGTGANAGTLGTPVPSDATGVYLPTNGAAGTWSCAHEFGLTDNGKRYWRPHCYRFGGESYAAHYVVWQYPEDCPLAGARSRSPMFRYGSSQPEWIAELVSYTPGVVIVAFEPVNGGAVETVPMWQAVAFHAPTPYDGCRPPAASKHHWPPEG